jgi:two-component system, OmpR family, copper resistance phosphate regulon response regulator CusR
VTSRLRILIAEDDEPLANFLKERFSSEQRFDVDVVHDGPLAQQATVEKKYDLVILDLNLPRASGLDVLQTIRARTLDLPILVVTGSSSVEDRVRGLDAGADDYLPKPFAFSELAARVRAVLRRRNHASAILKIGDLELNRVSRTVCRGSRNLDLSPKEFELLEYLMLHADAPVPRAAIIEDVWKSRGDGMTNVVDVYVNYLRRKIDGGAGVPLIQTIRGVGYQLGTMSRQSELTQAAS